MLAYPEEKYEAERTLGHGQFGVTYLCRKRWTSARRSLAACYESWHALRSQWFARWLQSP